MFKVNNKNSRTTYDLRYVRRMTFYFVWQEKCFSCYVLLTDQTSLSDFKSFQGKGKAFKASISINFKSLTIAKSCLGPERAKLRFSSAKQKFL